MCYEAGLARAGAGIDEQVCVVVEAASLSRPATVAQNGLGAERIARSEAGRTAHPDSSRREGGDANAEEGERL